MIQTTTFAYHEKILLTARVLFTEFCREVVNLDCLMSQIENYRSRKSLTLHNIMAN